MGGFVCGDCRWMDLHDLNRYNEAYCKEKRKYYPVGDRVCSKFEASDDKYKSSCYLTTVVCYSLGYADDCYILERLRYFRDKFMKNDISCLELLKEYKTVGKMISDAIASDPLNKDVAAVLLEYYLNPAIRCINKKDYYQALHIYTSMVNALKEKYLDESKEQVKYIKKK